MVSEEGKSTEASQPSEAEVPKPDATEDGAADDAAEDDGSADDDGAAEDDWVPAFDVPKRRVWPVFVGLALVFIIGGFLFWRNAKQPVALRVLIAIDVDGYWWDDSKAAATLADEIGDFLSDRGFEIIRSGQPNVDEVLAATKDPLDAARELRASYLISAKIDPTVEKIPLEGGFFEVWMETTLDVQYTPDETPFFTTPLTTSEGAVGRKLAVDRLAKLTSKVARAEVLPALMGHEQVRDILGGSERRLMDQLEPAKEFVSVRKRVLDEKLALYDDVATSRESGERGAGALTFHSDKRAEDQLVGVTDKGVLVVRAPEELYWDPVGAELLRRVRLESMEWVAAGAKGGPDPEVIWRGYNAFTYPSMSADGATVVMIEDLYGAARSLTVIRDGKRKRLVVEQKRAISQPRISPKASKVALVDRACRRCDEEIAVRSLAPGSEGKELFRVGPADYERIGGFKWLDESELLVVAVPKASKLRPAGAAEGADDEDVEPTLGVYVVTLDGKWELLFDKGFKTYVDPVVGPKGKWLVVSDYRQHLAIRNLETNETRLVDVGGRASALSFSRDGKRVVFEIDRLKGSFGHEIMLLDVAEGAAKRVTHNGWPDRYPVFSTDGQTIYFEARNHDPVFSRRTLSRIASVKAP